jgi:very-short-patch-repair endonuclease
MSKSDDFTWWRTDSARVRSHAREMRLDLTPQERVLWAAIRNRRVRGIKFRRQVPIGSFIVDFYAPEVGLIVEVDGDVHEATEQQARDARREQALRGEGHHIIRFTNMEIGLSVEAVVEQIAQVIDELREQEAGPSAER